MFPQWVNQSNFYTYIIKQFEYHYANQLAFDIQPYIDEFTKDMSEEEKEQFFYNSDNLFDQAYSKISKDGELVYKKLETYRDLKYYSNQIFASIPKDNKWTKSKTMKKYQSALSSMIRDHDYLSVESDPSLLVSKTYEYAEKIGDMILENDQILQYIVLFFTKIDLDLYHESEISHVLHGYFILLQFYFHDPANAKIQTFIDSVLQVRNHQHQISKLLKQQVEAYFEQFDQLEKAASDLSRKAKSERLDKIIGEQMDNIESEIQKHEQNRNRIEALIDEHIDFYNEEMGLFSDYYLEHKERIHQKCENYYNKYFKTNQEEKEKILSYMIFAETPRKYNNEDYEEYFSMDTNKRNYPFLEQIKHYCFYDIIQVYMGQKIEFDEFAHPQYTHRFINLYLQIFAKLMFGALVYAYRSNPNTETFLVNNIIEQDLMNQLKSNRKAQENYENFIVDITKFHDYPLNLRNNVLKILPDHQKILVAIFCLLIDFDKNIDFFFNKLKEATDPYQEEEDCKNVYFYPINQKKSELTKNTLELEKVNKIDPYMSIYPVDCFNDVYNFIELYKQDPITLAAASHLNRMILQLIHNFDDPSAINEQMDYYSDLESVETLLEYKKTINSSKATLPEIKIAEDPLQEENEKLKNYFIWNKVITIIKSLMHLPKKEAEEYYRIAFDEALLIQKAFQFKDLGMNYLYSLEQHNCVLNERGKTIAALLTRYILNYPNTIFGEFLSLSKKKQYTLLFLLAFFDKYYSIDAVTVYTMASSEDFLNEEENDKLAKKYQLLQKEIVKQEGKQKEIKQQFNTLKDENEELKRQLAYYKKKEKEAKDLIKPYEQQINQLTSQYTKQLDSLTKQIENYEKQSTELNKLRELVFHNEKQTEEYIDDNTYEQEYLKEFCNHHKVVLAGGRFEVQRALKNSLSIIPYGNHFSSNADVLKNADYIFISYKWFNHSDYAIIQNIVSTNPQIEWDYLAHDNINLVIHDLYQFITKKK